MFREKGEVFGWGREGASSSLPTPLDRIHSKCLEMGEHKVHAIWCVLNTDQRSPRQSPLS